MRHLNNRKLRHTLRWVSRWISCWISCWVSCWISRWTEWWNLFSFNRRKRYPLLWTSGTTQFCPEIPEMASPRSIPFVLGESRFLSRSLTTCLRPQWGDWRNARHCGGSGRKNSFGASPIGIICAAFDSPSSSLGRSRARILLEHRTFLLFQTRCNWVCL